MADVLAISAAVAQFLGIAAKLASQLYALYEEIRNVPKKLRSLKVDIDWQITIAQYVQSTLAMFESGSPPTLVVSTSIDQPLADYITAMEQLIEAVGIITKPDDNGVIRRSWNALRATQKCKEVMALCELLQNKKSDIIMWLTTANMELSFKIIKLLQGVDKKVDQTLRLTLGLEETSMKRDLQLSQLSFNMHSLLSQSSNDVFSFKQELLGSTAGSGTHVRTLVAQEQEFVPTSHELAKLLHNTSHLQEMMGQTALNDQYPSTQDCQTPSSRNIRAEPKVRLGNVCICQEIVHATSNEPLSFLHFRKVFRQYHYRHCPRSRSSARSLEYLVKIMPPYWLLSHTVHLGIQFWHAKGSWSISPLIIGSVRRIDPTRAPAFQIIGNVRKVVSSGNSLIPAHIKDLERTFKDLFYSQQASVYDEDPLGNTLLFEIMDLYLWRGKVQRHDPCAKYFVSLIQFLLDSGSDPNIYRCADRPQVYEGSISRGISGTVLDAFAVPLMCHKELTRGDQASRALVYRKLLDYNSYFTQSTGIWCKLQPGINRFSFLERGMEHLKTFEGQQEVSNLTSLMVAIIREVEADFNRAILKDNIREVSNANGLTAIHFAIFWPWALRQLIAAGADVNCEDGLSRRPIHLATGCGRAEAVVMLLEADCSVYTPDYSNSLLQEALIRGRDFDHVTGRIIEALIDRHTRLINLASSVLPESSNTRKLYGQGNIVETNAPKLIDALAKAGCPVSPSLETDRDGEGVYDTADHHARIRLTPSLADKLWGGGFRRIEYPAPVNALTPLLQSWYAADFDMVSWFIEKGASPFTKRPGNSHSALHLFATRIANPGAHFHHDHSSIPCHEGLVKQLTENGNMWHDSCHCICSPKGCTPISIAVKQYSHNGEINYKMMLDLSRSLHKKSLYRPEEDSNHIEQLLDIFVFEKLKFRHTCCRIGQLGEIDNISTLHHQGRTVYAGLEAGYQQSLREFGSKMLQCGCDIIEKPACVVFREKCKKGR